jgi:hypothetical protein
MIDDNAAKADADLWKKAADSLNKKSQKLAIGFIPLLS